MNKRGNKLTSITGPFVPYRCAKRRNDSETTQGDRLRVAAFFCEFVEKLLPTPNIIEVVRVQDFMAIAPVSVKLDILPGCMVNILQMVDLSSAEAGIPVCNFT